ncbi:PEP-CTERM sorting domain-containing protein [Planctomycetales bacterium ZRK34]|nr:PEP-CTERM sorting domain-containing protein [Planctomycetales bacterium ZRK34]
MKFNTIQMIMAMVAAALLSAGPTQAAFTAVGVYDENSVQTNAVDTVATSDANPNQLSLSTFTTQIAAAYAAGFGGVVNFDSGTLTDPNTSGTYPVSDTFDVSYAGGAKSLRVTDIESGDYTGPGSFSERTAISGSQFLAQISSSDFWFDFGAITGGAPGEAVTAVGLTVLSRANASFPQDVTVLVRFTNDVVISIPSNIASSNGGDDTFFGIVAPEGESIVRVVVNISNNTAYTGVDDFAFITSIIVPEPGTCSLLVAGCAILLRRRRV